jgi:hypothetical protein
LDREHGANAMVFDQIKLRKPCNGLREVPETFQNACQLTSQFPHRKWRLGDLFYAPSEFWNSHGTSEACSFHNSSARSDVKACAFGNVGIAANRDGSLVRLSVE